MNDVEEGGETAFVIADNATYNQQVILIFLSLGILKILHDVGISLISFRVINFISLPRKQIKEKRCDI